MVYVICIGYVLAVSPRNSCEKFANWFVLRLVSKEDVWILEEFFSLSSMLHDERVIWRCTIWSLLDHGKPADFIKEIYGVSLDRHTLERYINDYEHDWKSRGIPTDKARRGRPSHLWEEEKKDVAKRLKQGESTRQLAKAYDVNQSTIVCTAEVQGIIARIPRIRTFLSELQLIKRLAYCQRIKAQACQPWKDVLWTDESVFLLTPSHRQYVWVDEGCMPEDMHRFKHPGSVWVWGGISWYGKTKLIILTMSKGGGFKAINYQEQVLTYVKDNKDYLLAKRGRLMEDGSRCHTAKINLQYRAKHNIKMFPPEPNSWPPNSPDLNPVENVWGWMKMKLHELPEYPTHGDVMVKEVQKIWKSITLETCRQYIQTYETRLDEVIEAKGGYSHY